MKVVYEPKVQEHDPALYEADSVALIHNGWDAIDTAAYEHYQETGYLIVREAYTPEEVKHAQNELEMMVISDDPGCESVYYEGKLRELIKTDFQTDDNRGDEKSIAGLALGYTGDQLPKLDPITRSRYVRKFMGFTSAHPPLARLANHPRLLALMRKLIRNEKVELFQEMAMIKPPGGREKPWHQDHAYFNHPIDISIIGVWIALGDVRPDNGCMYLLPGVHKQGPMPHFMKRDWQICDADIYEELAGRRIAAHMNAGDVLIFDSKLPHGTPKNRTDSYRWAVQLHYRAVGSLACPDEQRLAAFGGEGKNASC